MNQDVAAHDAAVNARGGDTARGRFKDRLRDGAHAVVRPIVRGLARAGVGPDAVSVFGLLFSLGAGLFFLEGAFRWGSVALMAAGLCDVLDGELARETRGMSTFGAFLDSTLDRIAEGAVLIGIAGFYLANLVELAHSPSRVLEELSRGLEPRTWAVVTLTAMVAILGSFLVSYTRARAEGLGLDCKVGWFERPERVVLLIAAGWFGVGPVMPGALLLLALLSLFTAAQRIRHVYKITRPGSPEARS
jgi:CDP-diacylglycerol--glycerol-3-phosphate 3-phosphatidyltransferase